MTTSGQSGPPPWWHPELYARRRPNLLLRQAVLAALRSCFAGLGFVEVETPALQVSPGLEPHLKAFETRLEHPDGSTRPLYLHTSPEFAMKKLLAAGEPKLFQLAPVFRNGERAATHHPAFLMLEWYRAQSDDGKPADYRSIMRDCETLLQAIAAATGRSTLTWQGHTADILQPWQYLTVHDAFARHARLDLGICIGADPHNPDLAAMRAACAAIGVRVDAGDSWDDLYFRVALDRVESHLGLDAPCILYDYPIHQAALSRPKKAAPHLAERFELYACGMELANAFSELTDAAEQRRRFEADMALKKRLYGYDYPIDGDFLAALQHGLPDCAGIALGVDRLVMLLAGASRIEEVLWLPVSE
ncbi:EF-P lysine aminoacylase EpmA [Ferrovibrio terrae]|uniref:EF-P lysine aminoacylase EpmA n=1 Tax=Ferrovibrio terrae TaxID=2594003 RepID=UPI003137A14A